MRHGAETSRVEDSVRRLLAAYVNGRCEVFAIPSLLLISIEDGEGTAHTCSRRITARDTNLDKIDQLNALCRDICAHAPAPREALRRVQEIDARREYPALVQIGAGAVIGFAFTLFFGGNGMEGLCALFCGAVTGFVQRFLQRLESNVFFTNVSASALAAAAALLATPFLPNVRAEPVIIGTLMNLVPGVALTNFMRDVLSGDLISGLSRLTEALLIAFAIALGACLALIALGRVSPS